jgi:hypothetical protein
MVENKLKLTRREDVITPTIRTVPGWSRFIPGRVSTTEDEQDIRPLHQSGAPRSETSNPLNIIERGQDQ